MLRYIALLWDAEDPDAQGAALAMLARARAGSSVWRKALDSGGCVVLIAGDARSEPARLIHGGRGVVLGHLFRTSQPTSRLTGFSEEESDRIAGSDGRSLITDFWGNYVAFMRDGPRRNLILRGPCATLPCLHFKVCGVDAYFSCMETGAELAPQTISIDWLHLARTLIGPFHSERTGLNEVREIRPGFCERLQAGERSQQCYWHAVEIARSNPTEDFVSAVIQLRHAAHASVHAWASRSPRILHALSGGLDSSIVLSCLGTAPTNPDVTCFTHFAEGADGDERPFARAVAEQMSYPHREARRVAEVDLRGAFHGVRLEYCPGMRVRDIERIEPDFGRSLCADAVFKGHGGDELFCRHNYFFAADLLRRHGPSRELIDMLAHAAIFEGDTFWAVLARAFRTAFIPNRWNLATVFRREQEGQSLLDPAISDAAASSPHFDLPYARTTGDCPAGKLWQISLVTARRPYVSPWWREGDPQTISPLLSQPLIEACLRIPTYLQASNRGERAVARMAFAGSLPREVIERRSKGGAEQLAWKTFRTNLPFIREVLLDGQLVRERVVNGARLEATLADRPSSDVRSTVPLFDLIGAEAWLQPWAAHRFRSVSWQKACSS